MHLRELSPDSVHWGGYAGMQLVSFKEDPLPSHLLGGLSVNEFLAEYLLHSTNPLATGLGFLSATESDLPSESTVSVPWSVQDPNSSFYNGVLDLLSAPPGPAFPSEAVRTVPRLVHHQMVASGVQSTTLDSLVEHEKQSFLQVYLIFHFLI